MQKMKVTTKASKFHTYTDVHVKTNQNKIIHVSLWHDGTILIHDASHVVLYDEDVKSVDKKLGDSGKAYQEFNLEEKQ